MARKSHTAWWSSTLKHSCDEQLWTELRQEVAAQLTAWETGMSRVQQEDGIRRIWLLSEELRGRAAQLRL